jgi:hypothetical protein
MKPLREEFVITAGVLAVFFAALFLAMIVVSIWG